MGADFRSRILGLSLALLASAIATRVVADESEPTQNPIQRENTQAGSPDWELEDPALEHEIEGYASLTSAGHDDAVQFFVNVKPVSASSPPPDYTIQIFRVGWYGGIGARAMTGPIRQRGKVQPPCSVDETTRRVECDWTPGFKKHIPNGWVSGVYLAKLTELGRGASSYVIFVVREDRRDSPYLFQLAVTTYQAYNSWGGHSLYTKPASARAREVSFNRPYGHHVPQPEHAVGASDFFNWEVNMLRYLEREGYDVSYATNVDIHESAAMLLRHQAFLSVGHDEYWSPTMRLNLESALAAGVSLAFVGGNPMYFRIRLEPSRISGAPNRTIVSYKEVACVDDPLAQDGDPSNDDSITLLWRWPPPDNAIGGDPFSEQYPGTTLAASCQEPRPEAALVGVGYFESPVDSDITVTNTGHWAFAGTGLQDGDSLPGLLGYEVDTTYPESPSNIVLLGQSPIQGGIAHMTIYEAMSGALVFATGTMQWNWGLDDYNPDGLDAVCCNRVDSSGQPLGVPKHDRIAISEVVQRITRNVLEAMAP